MLRTLSCILMQPEDVQKAVGAALQVADCLLATYESVEVPGFPFGGFYCVVEYARCPLNQPSSAAAAALASAPCTRSGNNPLSGAVPLCRLANDTRHWSLPCETCTCTNSLEASWHARGGDQGSRVLRGQIPQLRCHKALSCHKHPPAMQAAPI